MWLKILGYKSLSNETLDNLYDSMLKELEIIGKLMGGSARGSFYALKKCKILDSRGLSLVVRSSSKASSHREACRSPRLRRTEEEVLSG
jgi:hypothetical protein